jgi:hypothetical protein
MAAEGCLVSSAYDAIGTRLYVYGRNTGALRLCTVVDVSGPRDRARHRHTGRIIELGYSEALTLCGNMGKPTDCPIVTIRLEEP